MPLETDLSSAPYYDDLDERKRFGKIIFKPTLPVQVRELNQLQSLLQLQIERFGDNIFKRGTIISGCNFIFYPSYPYVKILDTDLDGVPVAPSLYLGYFVKNTSNVIAYVVNTEDGFETSDPDLNTLFVSYIAAGDDGNTHSFSPGDTLTIFDSSSPIMDVVINNGGLNFSNTDELIITSALVINVSTGTFSNGTNVYTDTATAQIVGIDSNTLVLTDQVILKIRPRAGDLANGTISTTAWEFSNTESIRNFDNSAVATIEGIIGASAKGIVTTDGAGRVAEVTITGGGSGYTTLPYVSIKSANNTSGIAALDLVAENFKAKVKIAAGGTSVGNGYAFGVEEGIIYQKGYFIRSEPQTIVVSKYDQLPNAVAVGFDTLEEIINSDADTSLLDNVLNENETAPGADRLRLTPTLELVTSEQASSNENFFTLVEWSEGNPFKQNRVTKYNVIEDEMATRLSEQSGDYVIDKFLVTTRSPVDSTEEGGTFSVVVDPGTAYIDGYRVQTLRNYTIDIDKGVDTRVSNTQYVSLNYGNFIRVDEVGGIFQFNTGDTVKLYNTAKNFLSNTLLIDTANLSPPGTQIGTARVRSILLSNGVHGEANTQYKLYLFDIRMDSGKNFKDTRTIYYDGAFKGTADVVLTPDPTTSTNVAILEGTAYNKLLFSTGTLALKNANNVNYLYRTIDQTLTTGNNGVLVKSIAASPDEFYPYTGTLTDTQMKELLVVPTGADLISFANLAGSGSVNTTSANIVGTSTTFLTELVSGDYVWIDGSGDGDEIKRVISVANNTRVVLDSNLSFANAAAVIHRVFPKNVPVPMGSRSGLTANVDANGNILTIDFGMTFDTATSTNTAVAVNIERRDVDQETKTPNRDVYVRLRLANNAANTKGPWCLGTPDIFRLKGVWIGNSTVSEATGLVATEDFYIDHNQNPNYLDLGWLFKKPGSPVTLISSDYMLVKFDYFTTSGTGFHDTVSYVSANGAQILEVDSLELANLSTQVNSFEIPEVYTSRGEYYDLMNVFDFRPMVANTAAPNATASSAPVNPSSTISFGNTADPANEKRFPVPDSVMRSVVEEYLPREDAVFLNKDGTIVVGKGVPAADPRKRLLPEKPSGALVLNSLEIPPYPNLTVNPSAIVLDIIDTGMGNERFSKTRTNERVIKTPFTTRNIEENQPSGYTMSMIGELARRIDDLEYISGISAISSDITDRTIPSSTDPALNRFKFGFFVDDYSTPEFTDAEHPGYSASLEDDDVVPLKEIWTTEYKDPGNAGYIDYVIVAQKNATKPATNTGSNGVGNCIPSTLVANTIYVAKGDKVGDKGAKDGKANSSVSVTMSAVAANVTLYFHNFSGNGDKIEIFQGNTLIKSSANAEVLTSADKTLLKSNSIPSAWFNGITFKDFTAFANSSGAPGPGSWVNNSGKISWIHSPASGRRYKIKVTKGVGKNKWRYALRYPIDRGTVACPVEPTPPVVEDPTVVDRPKPKPPKFMGTLKVQLKRAMMWTLFSGGTIAAASKKAEKKKDGKNDKDKNNKNKDKNKKESVPEVQVNFVNQFLRVKVTGLKPGTKHDFYIDNEKANKYCRMTPDSVDTGIVKNSADLWYLSFGGPLTTNNKGKLDFEYYYLKAFAPNAKVSEDKFLKGKKLFEVKAGDNSLAKLMVNMEALKKDAVMA